jgi:hypothetical protein
MKACVGVRKKKMCSLTNADLVVVNPRDMILKITSAAIFGSDLHLLQWFHAHDGKGRRPVMSRWGKSSQSAAQTLSLTPMIRAVIPFTLMRECFFWHKGAYSTLRHIEPRRGKRSRSDVGQSPAGLFAYSHMLDAFAENKS